MPALDKCHPQIVRAMEKDGWQVDPLPHPLRVQNRRVFVDISATRRVNGSGKRVLLAEVKCFAQIDSTTQELYTAIGQYLIYLTMLSQRGIDTPLYLVIPEHVYQLVFDSTVELAFNNYGIKAIIVDLDQERIVQWKD
jgi:hypothetical protein